MTHDYQLFFLPPWLRPLSAAAALLLPLIAAPKPLWSASAPRTPPTKDDPALGAGERVEAFEKLLALLKSDYVEPELAARMESDLRARQARGEYEEISGCRQFSKLLTDQLQAISHDKHLRVRTKEDVQKRHMGGSPADFEAHARQTNFGFEKLERLAGNIGYLDLREFMPVGLAGETATGAMAFLANTDALVIDLRQNGGGAPDAVQFLASFLFEDSVHLNDLYNRPMQETRQFWTLPQVPGKRYLDKEVFVLTSAYTFSAAEEFAYDLQCQHRATIVGETSGGGANPGDIEDLSEHITVFLPSGKAINPVTKTNWEGKGVVPEVPVAADEALGKAHALALEHLLAKETKSERKDELQHALEEARAPRAAAERR